MTLPKFTGSFMPTVLAAAPGTYVVEINDEGVLLKTPVIAFAPDAENPYRAPHVITLSGLRRLIGKAAVLFPCGMVDDPNHPICFSSVDEWAAVPDVKHAKVTKSVTPAADDPDDANDETGGNGPEITWAKKPYATNSFFRYDDENWEFVFTVPGGVNPPKAAGPVTKIKRDDFMELKKTLDVADIQELLDGTYGASEEQVEADEDEDDGMDLI